MADSMGAKLALRYLLLRPLGHDGMGTLWLARDEMLGREVAVEEVRIPEGGDGRSRAELVARVMREAEAVARLRHPAIVAVHDVLVEDGRPWIVMERLRGRTLDDELAARGPRLPLQVATIGAFLLEALVVAHAHDVQHRDVRPGNVFLTDDDRVVLIGFGVARFPDRPTPADRSQVVGQVIGTPGFVAPERLAGGNGGPASDLWSLGATLFIALEGVPPYDGSPAEVAEATLARDRREPRDSGPLTSLLRWLMAREPEARPDAEIALGLLRQIADGESPRVTAPPTIDRRTRRWTPAVLLAVATAVASAVAAILITREPTSAARPVSPVFEKAVDLCEALSREQITELLGAPAEGRTSANNCEWTTRGAGVELTAVTGSGTPDPWSLSPGSAHGLFAALERRQAHGTRDMGWTWYEIGVEDERRMTRSAPRTLTDVGDEAFSWNAADAGGRVHMTVVTFRLGNLVADLHYANLGTASGDALREAGAEAARSAVATLRGLG
ncbi:serine/threonine-protein kinase [Streptosporangium sp. NPDC002721]|uniref:serine/threonine-protein kinase n=1 Tax=Streptosporangium sp. NPDC002721 TaxID=3366188 RepID=UPI0036951E9F